MATVFRRQRSSMRKFAAALRSSAMAMRPTSLRNSMGSSMVPSARVMLGLNCNSVSPSGRPLPALAMTRSLCSADVAARSAVTLMRPPSKPGAVSATARLAASGTIASTDALPLASASRPCAKEAALPSSMPSLSQMTRNAVAPEYFCCRLAKIPARSGSRARGCRAAVLVLIVAASAGSRLCGRACGVDAASVTGAPARWAPSRTSAMISWRLLQSLAAAQLSSTTSSKGVGAMAATRPGA